MLNSPILEQRYGARIRHYQMKMGLGGEIKHLVLQVLHEADRALAVHEITKRIEPLLSEDFTKRMWGKRNFFIASELVDGALTILFLDDHKVRKEEVYSPNKQKLK